MTPRRGRVILAGYPPELPDLVSVRALDRALVSGLTIAPPDLPRDFGNRATVWVDTHLTIKSVTGLWDQVTETLGNGQNVLRWFPDNPLATSTGQQDAHDLHDAGVPIEIVPVVPSELTALTFAGVPMPEQPRSLSASGLDPINDFWVTQHGDDRDRASMEITAPGTPAQVSGATMASAGESTFIGGNGAERRLVPNWFESLPLFGRRILVTRTISQAPVFSRALRELGAEPVEMPAIDIIPNPYPERTRQAADNLSEYEWVIFTSANTVDVFVEAVRQAGYDARRFRNAQIAAIGPATAERLRRNFIEPDFIPDEFVAEAVLEGLRERAVTGCRILLPRAEVARETLPDGLREIGATVDVVPVYRTVSGTPDPAVIARIDAGEIDTVTFTSSSTVTNLIDMLDRDTSRLNQAEIACIGPITAETVRQHGLPVTITATEYTVPGLIDALCIAREDSQ